MADENGSEMPPPTEEQTIEQTTEQTTESTEESTEELEIIADAILDTDEMKKMFVGGITTDSKDEELKEFFEKMSGGKVTDNVIIRKDADKKSHFGFITFETSELVDEVLLKREELKFKDRMLDVNRAVPKGNTSPGAHEKTKKLFIANLPKFDCSEDELRKYFEQRHPKKYGTIESIQLIKKKDDQGNKMEENKGYGFIMVSSEDLADKMAIQHATFEFGGRRIELKKSVPTGEGGGGRGGGRRGGGRQGGGGHQAGGFGGANPYYGGQGYGGTYGAGDWSGYGGQYGMAGGYGGYGYGDYAYGGGYGGQQPGGRGGRGGRYRPY